MLCRPRILKRLTLWYWFSTCRCDERLQLSEHLSW
uniref:Uncharacterized protein n=1 Tax=Anguilla anguilla TaxID=7936 RepID=A0A0E9R107_ANGAN